MEESPAKPSRSIKPPFALRLARGVLQLLGHIAPGLAARLAYRLWHYPRRHNEPKREAGWRADAKHFTIPFRNEKLAAWRWGEGPVVLLVHGWDGRGNQLGSFAGPLVKAGYSAVAFDLPAHGLSTGKTTNMLNAADAICAVADAVGPVDAVIAHSFGAGALARALAKGLKPAKAVMISPPANLRWMADNFYRTLGVSTPVQHRIEKLVNEHYGVSIWQDVSADHNLRAITIPGLIAHDVQDHEVPFAQSKLIEQSWSGARLLETSGLGHRRILRDQKVIQEVIDFIA